MSRRSSHPARCMRRARARVCAQLLVAQEWVAAHPAAFRLTDLLIRLGLFSLAGFVRAAAAAVANAVISSVRVTLAQLTLDP